MAWAYTGFQAAWRQHIDHHIPKRETLDHPPRGGNNWVSLLGLLAKSRGVPGFLSDLMRSALDLFRAIIMSENNTVSSEAMDASEVLEDAQEWGDSGDVGDASGTSSEIPSSEIPPSAPTPELFTAESTPESDSIPPELREFISLGGVRLVRCENAWNVDGWAAKLRKNLSVTFGFDGDITGEDILDGFEQAGINTEKVVSIQRRISNRTWVVSFSEQAEKDRVISKGRVTIKGAVVFVGDADCRTDIVKIFEAPDEMPDTVVIGRLSCFGRVLSFRRDVAPATGVRNGVRTARVRISRDIPCSIHVAGEALSIKYSSQPRSCRRCGGSGHLANDCKQPRCYNCDLPGHRAMECEESVLCGVCFRSNHPLSECPYVMFSANVAPSYAEAATADPTANPPRTQRTPEQRDAMRAAAEAAKKKEVEEKKRREKERREKEQQKQKEREEEEQREKQREERRRRREKEEQEEKRKEEERVKRKADEKEDERRRREDDRGRGRDRDRDWSRQRDRHSRERGRDYEHYRDYDRYYRDRDRDRRRRDHSPYYSESDYEGSKKSSR